MRLAMRRALLFVVAVLLIALAGCGNPTTDAPTSTDAPPAPGAVLRDVTYCSAARVALKLDLYFPRTAAGSPTPVAVYVHGGGWSQGSKSLGGWELQVAEGLVTRGYLVAAVDYRLAPQYKWPAQIEDVKCAIRFLRAHADAYHLDPDRIGAWGDSAGGHLVAMLGVAGPSAGFDGSGGYTDQSSRVLAVVDLFGPADLTAGGWGPNASGVVQSVFGVSPGQPSDVLARASPVTYITADAPPFLIMQGDQDTTVPPSQSQELYTRLQAAGVPATLVIVHNAGHGFVPAGGPISPSLDQLRQQILDFFAVQIGAVE
jgi:acetyl esterase/lipase